jgi:hypothetical protein
MPLTEITLPVWQFRGSVDDLPEWLKHPATALSEATAPEVLQPTGRQVAPGTRVLRLGSGGALAPGDYAIRAVVGHEPIVVHGADLEQRHGIRA